MAQHQKEPDIPTRHLSEEKRRELDEKARQGETVVPGGTGGKSLEAQERLAEGRSRGGQTRSGQLGAEGYEEMGRKGGKSAGGKSAEEAMAEKECTLTNLSSRPNPKTECFRSGKTMSQEGAEKQLFKCVHSQVGECMNMFHFASCSRAHVAFA